MSPSSSGVHGEEAQTRPGRTHKGRHDSGHCSRDGTAVLVDEAAEQVATVTIESHLIRCSLGLWRADARPGVERPRLTGAHPAPGGEVRVGREAAHVGADLG